MDATACTILLVDDEEANLDLLGAVLRPRGYRSLVRVSDAREAAAAFAAARPDLVLLDLHMPHRTGFEVLAEIRALVPPDEYLPILVLTADVTSRARERALQEGAHDFLTKPFDRTEVLLRVRNLLQTRLLYAEQRRARAAAEAAAARDRLLAEAGRLLGASFDATTSLTHLARVAAGGWADACAVDLSVDGTVVRAASYPSTSDDAPSLPSLPDPPLGILSAVAVGDAVGGDGAGALRVPLAAGTGTAGWMTVVRGRGGEPFGDDDLALAGELGRRAALALENARSFQAAQDALAARDQVLAVVAHDLRGPLSAIRFELEMLRAEPTHPLSPDDDETLERVERTTVRMDGLIQDLLDVARINRGVLAVEPYPCDMAALLAEAAAALRPLVEGQGMTFDARIADALGAAWVDPARIVQAVGNLVGNAAKFARQNGRVTLACAAEDGELRIRVGDDGPGIEPAQLQHIFGAFWQARHADRRGLGLGLAIARAIAEAHAGRLWVESEVGHGSTFILALPIDGGAENHGG